jgi:hypothetical protein
VVRFTAGGFRSLLEIAFLVVFVQHGVGLDSRSTKNECDMIQPTARRFARKAKPPAGCPTGGFDLSTLLYLVEPISA